MLKVIFSYVNKYNFRVIRLTWRRDQRWSLTDRRREEWRRWDVWRRWSWGKERRRHLGRFSLRAGMFRDHLQVLKSHFSVPRYMFPACQFYRGDCHVCNLDVIPLQIVATSSFHPANGGSLSANHIYVPGIFLQQIQTYTYSFMKVCIHFCAFQLCIPDAYITHTSVGLN